jgi:hypothetical protein
MQSQFCPQRPPSQDALVANVVNMHRSGANLAGCRQTRPTIPAVVHHTRWVDGNRRFLPVRRDENGSSHVDMPMSESLAETSATARLVWSPYVVARVSRFRVVAASSLRRAQRSSRSHPVPVRHPSRRRDEHDARRPTSKSAIGVINEGVFVGHSAPRQHRRCCQSRTRGGRLSRCECRLVSESRV